MSKKTKKAQTQIAHPAAPPRWRWLTKPWGVAVVVGGAVGAFLLNINPVLTNVRQLPAEVRMTRDQFASWYYQDSAWNGRWTNSPEGNVDAAAMRLSEEAVEIELEVQNGVIDGTIATRQICDAVPFFDFLLLRGKVSALRSSAKVVVWDTFLGRSQDVATLTLNRDGAIITVVPKQGAVSLFPAQARVALDPSGTPASFSCDRKEQQPAR